MVEGSTEKRKAGETARQYAYRLLRNEIISLELKPGSPFNDGEFAGRIGLSRTPVREAVIQLSEESRIIEIFPQRGMRVSLIDMSLVEEARFCRLALEKEAVRLACRLICDHDKKWMDEIIQLQEFYLKGDSPERFMELDNEMHRRLFSICGKELSYELCQRLSIHYDRIRSLSVTEVKDCQILDDHKKLFQAICCGDGEQAAAVMDAHLNRWKVNEDAFRSRHPDYFKES